MSPLGSLSRIAWSIAAALWGVATVGVWAWTTRYEFTTYAESNLGSPIQWPAATRLALADDRPTLLFFVHPRCPCTRASVRELERTLTGTGLSESLLPKLNVVASLPPNAANEWRDTDTLRRASTLPHAEMYWDVGGTESSRFGATTSGAVQLYRQDGKLLFSGGITASRGHEGDSTGGDHLYALLSQKSQAANGSTPVFGCRLCAECSSSTCGEAGKVDPPGVGVAIERATP